MDVTVWLAVKPKLGAYSKKIEGANITLHNIKPTSAVTPDTVMFEMNLKIDPAIFEYPTFTVNLKSSPIAADAIMAELKEWTGER